MSISASNIPVWPRRAPVASCLAVALGLCAITASGRDRHGSDLPQGRVAASATSFVLPSYPTAETPVLVARDSLAGGIDRPASILQVMNCDDSGPGSLRDEIAAAASGATIDLSQLACSTITLGSQIDVMQDNLSLVGPGADHLTIDADLHSRTFLHTGAGTLGIYSLSVVNGYYASNNGASGGCIASDSRVVLVDSVVSRCLLYGTDATNARGGAVFAASGLVLNGSNISDSHVYSVNGAPIGGAAYVGYLQAKYSTISDNTASSPLFSLTPSLAGGIFAFGDVTIEYSTLSNNHSYVVGALAIVGGASATASITNSTISSNIADTDVGGIYTTAPLALVNSTVFGNWTHNSSSGAGLRIKNTTLTAYASIVAGNGGPAGEGDISGDAFASFAGSDNLVVVSTLPPPAGTLEECPHVEPLADNGGRTLTHALRHDSPAIDHGSNTANLLDDQRLAPRVAGPQADIGAVEWQPGETEDRLLVSNFDGLCDG